MIDIKIITNSLTIILAGALASVSFFTIYINDKSLLILSAIISFSTLIISAIYNIYIFHKVVLPDVNKSNSITISEISSLLEKVKGVLLAQERRLFSTWSETEMIEKGSTEIWIITLDFYWDLNNSQYANLVKEKVKNEDRYWWIYPNGSSNSAEILKKRLNTISNNNIHFTPIINEITDYFPHDVVIYNPDTENPTVILCDVNGRKGDIPSESLDMPITDKKLALRYIQLFEKLANGNNPPWITNK